MNVKQMSAQIVKHLTLSEFNCLLFCFNDSDVHFTLNLVCETANCERCDLSIRE